MGGSGLAASPSAPGLRLHLREDAPCCRGIQSYITDVCQDSAWCHRALGWASLGVGSRTSCSRSRIPWTRSEAPAFVQKNPPPQWCPRTSHTADALLSILLVYSSRC